MKKRKYAFGTFGTWHRPASETTKSKEIPVVVLEHLANGLLYIFAHESNEPTLTHKTATILESSFTPKKYDQA